MNRNCAEFETIQDIMKTLDFGYDEAAGKRAGMLESAFQSFAGGKFSTSARIYDILEDNTAVVVCSDAVTANELYMEKDKLLNIMDEKVQKSGIKIKDIKIDYKKWKERNDE